MKGKPDINSFLSGAGTDNNAAEEMAKQIPKTANVEQGRITKTIRITRALERKLKEEAFRRSMAGERTAESDLIEVALLDYFNK